MKKQVKNNAPFYEKIYRDLLQKKNPQMKIEFPQGRMTALDVIELNHKIFSNENKDIHAFNMRYRFYDLQTIFHILDYQKCHRLNDTSLSAHFTISRNTIRKWKKKYLD